MAHHRLIGAFLSKAVMLLWHATALSGASLNKAVILLWQPTALSGAFLNKAVILLWHATALSGAFLNKAVMLLWRATASSGDPYIVLLYQIKVLPGISLFSGLNFLNPFRVPNPRPILNPSNLSPKWVSSCKGVKVLEVESQHVLLANQELSPRARRTLFVSAASYLKLDY